LPNAFTSLQKPLKNFGKITRAVKTGWAPPIKTHTYVTDLLSGMVTGGYPSPSPPAKVSQRKLLLLLSNQKRRQPWQGTQALAIIGNLG